MTISVCHSPQCPYVTNSVFQPSSRPTSLSVSLWAATCYRKRANTDTLVAFHDISTLIPLNPSITECISFTISSWLQLSFSAYTSSTLSEEIRLDLRHKAIYLRRQLTFFGFLLLWRSFPFLLQTVEETVSSLAPQQTCYRLVRRDVFKSVLFIFVPSFQVWVKCF